GSGWLWRTPTVHHAAWRRPVRLVAMVGRDRWSRSRSLVAGVRMGMVHRAGLVRAAMRLVVDVVVVVVAVSLAIAPAYADTPRSQPTSQEPKAAPAPAAPDPAVPAPAPTAPAPAPAPAAPAPGGQPRVLPPASLQDVMPRTPKPADKVTGGLSFGGGFSAGAVIVPQPHDRAWPKGMLIEPPDVNDAMAIAPGTDGLAQGKRRAPGEPQTWSQQIADAIHQGLGALVELTLPRSM